jgi:hypothetical protein
MRRYTARGIRYPLPGLAGSERVTHALQYRGLLLEGRGHPPHRAQAIERFRSSCEHLEGLL